MDSPGSQITTKTLRQSNRLGWLTQILSRLCVLVVDFVLKVD